MSKVQWMNLCFPCLCISLVVDSKQLDGGGPHRCFCWCKQIWAALMLHLSRSSAGHQRRFKWHDTCHEESQKSNTCTFTYHLPITSYMCMCILVYILIQSSSISVLASWPCKPSPLSGPASHLSTWVGFTAMVTWLPYLNSPSPRLATTLFSVVSLQALHCGILA